MLKLGRVTKFKMLFLVLVFVFNFDLFKFSAAILEKGLLQICAAMLSQIKENLNKPKPALTMAADNDATNGEQEVLQMKRMTQSPHYVPARENGTSQIEASTYPPPPPPRAYPGHLTIDNYKCEDYLHQVTNTRHRIALTKLRLSNHKLAIETGRYSRPFKKPAERICPICKIEMEDEYHFLNICPAYQDKRCSLLDYLEKEYRIKISRMSPNKIFMFLINPPSGNVKIQKMIAKHIFECFEKRKGEDGKATLGLN